MGNPITDFFPGRVSKRALLGPLFGGWGIISMPVIWTTFFNWLKPLPGTRFQNGPICNKIINDLRKEPLFSGLIWTALKSMPFP
jgi:hypothetical protein